MAKTQAEAHFIAQGLSEVTSLDQLRELVEKLLQEAVEDGQKFLNVLPAIRMLLTCPMPGCGQRHIDEDVFETKPHHTHECQHCGHCWRPAILPTVGVRFLFREGGS